MTDRPALTFEILTYDKAKQFARQLLGLGRDLQWDNWTEENLLADRPAKWLLSLLARKQDVLVGYVICSQPQADTIHIHHFVVGSEWRSRGVGAGLLDALIHSAYQRQITRITLKVYKRNTTAIAFYQSHGFTFKDESDNDLAWMQMIIA